MSQLEEIEAIKQLKYRYFRCLDTKDWAGIRETLAEDATSAYDGGKYSFEGRDAIVQFLSDALGSSRVVSRHHGHHPEIELVSETAARGTWYLEDYVLFCETKLVVRGAAFYHDEYEKIDGRWRIKSTGYERTYEIVEKAGPMENLRTMFDGSSLSGGGAT